MGGAAAEGGQTTSRAPGIPNVFGCSPRRFAKNGKHDLNSLPPPRPCLQKYQLSGDDVQRSKAGKIWGRIQKQTNTNTSCG